MPQTLLQLRTRVARTLSDAGMAYWTSAEIDDAINEAQRIYVRETECLRKPVTLSNDATYDTDHPTAFYTFSGSDEVLTISAVRTARDGSLMRATVASLDESSNDWENETGDPIAYVYGDYGHGILRFWPKPSSALTTARVMITVMPATLSDDADVPSIPAFDHDCLHDGAVAILSTKDDPDTVDPTKAQGYGAKFGNAIQAAKARASTSWDSTGVYIYRPYL